MISKALFYGLAAVYSVQWVALTYFGWVPSPHTVASDALFACVMVFLNMAEPR
jgi:hypothetical protein